MSHDDIIRQEQPEDDDEDDDDRILSMAPPKKRKRATDPNVVRRNLELRWSLMASNEECDLEDMLSCGGMCEECDGEGVLDCRFCTGTGFFTVGDRLVGQGKSCPVCGGCGEEECKGCMGRKWVARWRQNDPSHLIVGEQTAELP